MKNYMIYACDGGEPLALVEALDPEEALDVALFEARARFLEWGITAPTTRSRLLVPFHRAYAMEAHVD